MTMGALQSMAALLIGQSTTVVQPGDDSGARRPPSDSTSRQAVEYSALSSDALIAIMPPAGSEMTREDRKSDWVEHSASIEMGKRIGAQARDASSERFSDDQWRRLLLNTGVIRYRAAWPRKEPFALSLVRPRWLENCELRVAPALPDMKKARIGSTFPMTCGTAQAWDDASGRSGSPLGLLPSGIRELILHVEIRIGSGDFSGMDWNDSPTAWNGVITTPFELVESWDEAVPPCTKPSLDAAVRDALGAGIRPWFIDGAYRNIAFVVVDPDCSKYPELATTAIDLRVELLKNDKVIETAEMCAADTDAVLLSSSVHGKTTTQKFFGTINLEHAAPSAIEVARIAEHYSVRVTGQAKNVRQLWSATQYWSGQLVIPWRELVERERQRVGPNGRGPICWTPFR